ncbi:MAG: 3-methyl-2-oxobutanoate hydroxymethyltransferase [Archaeoglobi archaeon]|nr:3-methyl-2-oxobutanoate hydroxymethyltransferase [Archaeoglobi archaeon]MDK2781885.1 3-methyl-2-oxobutanoate hydroxymethyltransferase [Archaeoglobi archaeon]
MSERKKVTVRDLLRKKEKGEKIVWVVLYDWVTASLADEAGVDMILVGDSMGMTVYGYPNTYSVTMDMMVTHVGAVARGAKYAFIVGDMPFMSYQSSNEEAVKNAGRLMSAGADAVKLEGGAEMAERVRAIVDAGVPVIGHLGLTPQKASLLGGFVVQGRDAESAKRIIEDAKALEEAGAIGVLLENVPAEVAKEVSRRVSILTFSIGGGVETDGQLLLSHDILGLTLGVRPKFAKQYANLASEILEAFRKYCEDVRTMRYPSEEYVVHMKEGEYEKLKELLK